MHRILIIIIELLILKDQGYLKTRQQNFRTLLQATAGRGQGYTSLLQVSYELTSMLACGFSESRQRQADDLSLTLVMNIMLIIRYITYHAGKDATPTQLFVHVRYI